MPAILVGLGDFALAALAALEAVAAFLLACAAIYMFVGIIRPVFRTVAHILPGGWSVLGHTVVPDIRAAWLRLEAALYQALLDWRRGSEIEIAFTWHWMAQAWRWNAGMVEWLAKETDASIEWLAHRHVPKWVKWATFAALPPLLIARIVKAVLPHIRATVVKPITYIERTMPGKTITIVRRAGAVALPSPWAFPRFRHWAHDIAAWRHITGRRLARLEALLTAAGLALAVAKLWGVRPACVKRNGNIAKLMRGVCGAPSWLLNLLAAGTVEAFIAADLCEFAYLLRKAAELEVPALMELVSVENALIDCHGTERPKLFALPPATPTPLQGVSPLAA